jgi:hypothetical protein
MMALSLFASSAGAPLQKPVVDSPIIGDVYNPPTSLEAMIERADAVVIGTIGATTEKPDARKRQARTDYELVVKRAVKEHPQLHGNTVVCRPGIGSFEDKDRVVRRYQPGMPEIRSGGDYLLFLAWDESHSCFGLAFGTISVGGFSEQGKLRDFRPHPAFTELEGLGPVEVAAKLQNARTIPK